MKPAFFCLIVLTLLVGCAVPKHVPGPTAGQGSPASSNFVPADMQGLYGLNPKNGYFAGHSITLKHDSFVYHPFTDAISPDMPKTERGKVVVSGDKVWLKFPSGHVSENILIRRHGRYLMFSPEDYAKYQRTGKLGDWVLFQR